MNIGILGLPLQSQNKGCEALTYSFFEVVEEIGKRNNVMFNIFVICDLPVRTMVKCGFSRKKTVESIFDDIIVKSFFRHINFEFIFSRLFLNYFFAENSINKLNYVFDFTAGDSFTDIYGKQRFYERTAVKEAIIKRKIPLILGSQTIGPFNDCEVLKKAKSVIQKSNKVFVRDKISYDYVKSISNIEPVLTTDIAFFLPYTRKDFSDSKRIKIGINPSGLLWNGGYTRDNQFSLTIDYRKYLREIITYLDESGKYEIHLIPHATASSLEYPDNDMYAINNLLIGRSNCIVCEPFVSAVEAKSYISGMDILIGSRMHATIAAISTGTPVIPISYSRKFEGLYSSLEYPYVISATKINTDEAISSTISWIERIDELKNSVDKALIIVSQLSAFLREQIESIILDNNS